MASAAVQTPQSPHTFLSNHPNPTLTQTSISIKPTTTKTITPRDITTTLNYFLPNADGSPPAPTYINRPETYERPIEPHTVTVHDVRGQEDKFTLDTTGFQVVKHESAEKEFRDEERIKSVYYKEVEEILKKATGANRVFIFDHTIRRPSPNSTDPIAARRGPVQRVHIDQSYKAAPTRVTHHLPDEASTLLQHRHQIINVWRPIKPILKDPLGIADARSVPDEDLVPIGLIYPNREGETYSVRVQGGLCGMNGLDGITGTVPACDSK
ncbi:hypothetical protein G7Y89_g11468 [Cudoniella acicularis]|uniref:Methyltransferase n=1 Tax=Cudoniella acicularis TaxID=354080 RepID=A0A8H4RAU2_9HELO|nr:hypothetical protein G7Y89_g11468 [Cudoniella acicularis]